ncbi:MAG: trypsin-like peptidase domain-containing protein, partial [bacterium]|nr:trypsin-like peptidase domain-containing protein [bacterium]
MSLWPFATAPDVLSKALALSEALRAGPPATPRPPSVSPYAVDFGILGVGVFALGATRTLVPGIFMDATATRRAGAVVPISEAPLAISVLIAIFGTNLGWLDGVYAWHLVPPELQLAPPAQVNPGSLLSKPQSGTLGTCVLWGTNYGVLTAGHVGDSLASAYDAAGAYVGDVVFTRDPANHRQQTRADVALISLAPDVPRPPRTAGAATLTGPSAVEVRSSAGSTTTSVIGKTSWFHFPAYAADYEDLYLTAGAVTQVGDSGSAVFLAGSTQVVGHVIGASPG